MKVFLDTNIFLRFYLRDVPEQFEECQILFQVIQQGLITPYTSSVVLLEINYVMRQTYKVPKQLVLNQIVKLKKLRNLTLIEKTDSQSAIRIYEKLNIKLGDCLIATQLPTNTTLVTYDDEFKKIPGLTIAFPGEVVKKLV